MEHPAETAIPIMPPELRFDFSGAAVFAEAELVVDESGVATDENPVLVVVGIDAADVELLTVGIPCAQVPFAPYSPATQPKPFFDTHPSSHTVTDAEVWQHAFPQHPRPLSQTLLSLQQS